MRDHMREYLDRAEADDSVVEGGTRIPSPKMFDVASFVGGVVGLKGKTDFPALSIDAYNKVISPTDENLFTYRYDGHITWMVSGDNAKVVEQQAKGYGAAIELMIREHFYQPYPDDFDPSVLPFTFVEFDFLRSEFFGAANVDAGPPKGRATRLWVDGGRIEVAWVTSEGGARQHG
jgi:hypothetical protein